MRLALSALALLAVAAVPTAAFADSIQSTGTATYTYGSSSTATAPTSAPTATGTTYVVTANPAWATILGTQWISTTSTGGTTSAAPNTYFTFSSAAAFIAQSVTGSFFSDNQATIYLFDATTNTYLGNSFSNTADSSFKSPSTAFSFTGLNLSHSYKLVASVLNTTTNDANTGNPVGVDIQAIAATPEPSSLMLLGTGLAGVAGFARRKMRS